MDIEKYDIFLCYRSNGGLGVARHLYDIMTRDGYSVSFDIDNIRKGLFDEKLLHRIDICTDFVVIIDEHAFDRTLDPNFKREHDWFRIELARAIKKGKNIIPVILAGSGIISDDLPDDIKVVKRYVPHRLDYYYFEDFYNELLTECIESKPYAVSKNNAILKILTDTDCRVFVDYEEKGIAHPCKTNLIPLSPGSYYLRFESLIDKNIFKEELEYEIISGFEKLCHVYLKQLEPELTPEDMYNKGKKYYDGNDVSQDYTLAVYWYKKSAEEGNSDAMYSLGYCYNFGQGVSRDYNQAVYWYKKSAEKGNLYAMNNLGNCYKYGYGVSKDYSQAVDWYKKSAEKGNADAIYSLSNCYKEGRGVINDKSIADALLETYYVARRGDTARAIEMVNEALK